MKKIFLYITILTGLFSCTEEIVIDLETGERMIGVYGSITTEKKKHTITISRSMDFYTLGAPDMVSGANVSVFDGTNTIAFAENPEHAGVYETIEEIAGEVGRTYQLSVSFRDNDGSKKHFSAESTLRPIPEKIDSAKILPYSFYGITVEDHFKICPYFQSIADKDMTYMVKIAINDVLITDTVTKSSFIRMMDLNGLYFNGPEMNLIYSDDNFPVGIYVLDAKNENAAIAPFDKFTIYLYSIENEYRRFIQDIRNSGGSSPFGGTPTNVRSNIKPAGKALGFFYTAAVIEYSFINTLFDKK
jgi:hypothetical protein